MGNNGTPQLPQGNPDMQFSQGQGISNIAPAMQMPSQYQMAGPAYPGADEQTSKMIDNMKAMQQSGVFDTPYQKAIKAHPILMGLANAAQSFGQGITKQPYYTGNQENQTQLQNTQQQGVNSISTLPAQMRMMMAMQGMGNMGGQSQGQTPGIPAMKYVLPQNLSQPGATVNIGGVPHVRDAHGNWTAQGAK